MPARRWLYLLLIFCAASISSVTFVATAQDSTTCPALINSALNDLGTNCANLERNTSCYGFETVQHTAFADTVPADFYTTPGDRSDLTITQAIQTGALSLPQKWGLNVMNVEANVPNGLPGKGVVFIQTGGVEVENGVQPGDAVGLVDGISLSTISQTDLLTWPAPSIVGHASELITPIPSGGTVIVDAVDPTQSFVRVVYQNQVGWISRDAIAGDADLTSLPTIGPDDMTPMQKFYFRVGIGGAPACSEAASFLFVQTPEGVPTDLVVFDTHFRINGTVIFRSLPPGDQLGNEIEIIVLSGLATIYPDTGNDIIVPPGFSSFVGLCPEFVSLGIEGDPDEKAICAGNVWSQPTPVTQADLDTFKIVEEFPSNVINDPIIIPIIIQASGSGSVQSQIEFPNQAALDAARAACLASPPQLSSEYVTI